MKNRKLILLVINFTLILTISLGSVFAGDSPARIIQDRQLQQLRKAIAQYEKLSQKHEWKTLQLPKTTLKLNDTAQVLINIKDRLELFDDLRPGRSTNEFTFKLEEAVKRFQFRHGIEEDGVIGPEFMRALNVPLEKRIEALKINLNRVEVDTTVYIGKRLIANIPEYKLYVYEDADPVLTMDIVVGKSSNQTVVFTDTLESIVFSPYWNVPESIVRNEIIPAMNKNSGYLSRNNMEITGQRNGLPVIRQLPGSDNSLGLVKFLFPNKYNIYFHDTPAKSLFERKKRAFSHGCIRLSEPVELAKYLLKDRPEWDEFAIFDAMHSGSEKWVKVNEPIPVSIIYYTSWIDKSGLIHFADDIYGLDKTYDDIAYIE